MQNEILLVISGFSKAEMIEAGKSCGRIDRSATSRRHASLAVASGVKFGTTRKQSIFGVVVVISLTCLCQFRLRLNCRYSERRLHPQKLYQDCWIFCRVLCKTVLWIRGKFCLPIPKSTGSPTRGRYAFSSAILFSNSMLK